MHKSLQIILFASIMSFCWAVPGFGQKFLALERYGKAKNIRIPIGTVITYQLREGQGWYTAEVVDLNYTDTLVIFPKIAIPLKEISALRYDKNWSKGVGASLRLFGVSWSAIAFVGTLTDKNPDTHYEWSDAVVTGSAYLAGFLLPRIFRYKTVELGKRKRLRIMDTRPLER